MSETVAIYRHFDAKGRLLYIGRSVNLEARMKAHKYSPWFPCIANVEVEHVDPEAAAEAEAEAIRTEAPIWNRLHRPRGDWLDPMTIYKWRRQGWPGANLTEPPLDT